MSIIQNGNIGKGGEFATHVVKQEKPPILLDKGPCTRDNRA